MKEESNIAKDVCYIEHLSFKERKEKELLFRREGNEFYSIDILEYNGYEYQYEEYCLVVWKPTDINVQPEFKGHPLYKVIPCPSLLSEEQIEAILENQPWVYI